MMDPMMGMPGTYPEGSGMCVNPGGNPMDMSACGFYQKMTMAEGCDFFEGQELIMGLLAPPGSFMALMESCEVVAMETYCVIMGMPVDCSTCPNEMMEMDMEMMRKR